LSGKLKLSHQQVFELEKDLATTKNSIEDFTQFNQQLQTNCKENLEKLTKLKYVKF
jgi:hypothetical protein